MYKYLIFFILGLLSCRSVHKTESKRSDKLTVDSTALLFKRSLSDVTQTNVNGKITTFEFEYAPLTPEQKAKGQTEPKPRLKKVTQAEFTKAKNQTKTDSVAGNQTDYHKQAATVQQNTTLVKKGGFPFWMILPITVAALILLYFKYGNLLNLFKRK